MYAYIFVYIEQSQPFRRAKQSPSMGVEQPQMQTPRQSITTVCNAAGISARRKRGSRHRKATEIEAAKKRRKLRDDLLDQEQPARWVAARDLVPSRGATAAQRIARIRERESREIVTKVARGL